MMIGDTINLLPRIRSGQLQPIAIASERRSSVLHEVPTFAEAGHPEIVSGPWFAVLAPAGSAIEIRRKLADQMRQILGQAEVQAKLKELGVESRGLTPEQFDAYRVSWMSEPRAPSKVLRRS